MLHPEHGIKSIDTGQTAQPDKDDPIGFECRTGKEEIKGQEQGDEKGSRKKSMDVSGRYPDDQGNDHGKQGGMDWNPSDFHTPNPFAVLMDFGFNSYIKS